MEPLLFRNGNMVAVCIIVAITMVSFNGATSFQKWKCQGSLGYHHRPSDVSMEPLLFRNGNTMQSFAAVCGSEQSMVSMEPLLFRNGNLAAKVVRLIQNGGFEAFQWSHFFSEMEITDLIGKEFADVEFQWSHFFSEMEMIN